MANRATKTEHAGAKKGRGAFWGRKREAKRASISSASADSTGRGRDALMFKASRAPLLSLERLLEAVRFDSFSIWFFILNSNFPSVLLRPMSRYGWAH